MLTLYGDQSTSRLLLGTAPFTRMSEADGRGVGR